MPSERVQRQIDRLLSADGIVGCTRWRIRVEVVGEQR
jgi:hypothetical protein